MGEYIEFEGVYYDTLRVPMLAHWGLFHAVVRKFGNTGRDKFLKNEKNFYIDYWQAVLDMVE